MEHGAYANENEWSSGSADAAKRGNLLNPAVWRDFNFERTPPYRSTGSRDIDAFCLSHAERHPTPIVCLATSSN